MISVITSCDVCQGPSTRVPATEGGGMTRKAVLSEWTANVHADAVYEMSQTEKRAYANLLGAWLRATSDLRWAAEVSGGHLATVMAKEAGHPIDEEERASLQSAVEIYVHDLARYCALHKEVARACRPRQRGALGRAVADALRGVERSQAVTAVREEFVYGIPDSQFLGNGKAVLGFVASCRGISPVRVTAGATEFLGVQAPPEDAVARRACHGEVLFRVEKLLVEIVCARQRAESEWYAKVRAQAEGTGARTITGGPESLMPDRVASMLEDVPALEKLGRELATRLGRDFPGWAPAKVRAMAALSETVFDRDEAAAIAGVESDLDVVTAMIEDLIGLEFRGRTQLDEVTIRRMYFAKINGDSRRREQGAATRAGTPKAIRGVAPADSGRGPVDRVSRSAASGIDPTADAAAEAEVEREGGLSRRAAEYLRKGMNEGRRTSTFELEVAIAILDCGNDAVADVFADPAALEATVTQTMQAFGPSRAHRVGMDHESTLDLVLEYISIGIHWVVNEEREEGEA